MYELSNGQSLGRLQHSLVQVRQIYNSPFYYITQLLYLYGHGTVHVF